MCDLCHQNPCSPRCPNSSNFDSRNMGWCAECGALITTESDDDVWVDDAYIYCCLQCALQSHNIVKYNEMRRMP